MAKKICIHCGVEKELSEYHNDSRCPDGHFASCKECERNRIKKWCLDNVEHRKEYSRKYHSEHKEQHALQMRKSRKNNPGSSRAVNLKYYYGHHDKALADRKKDREANHQREYCHGVIRNLLKFKKITKPNTCSLCGLPGKIDAHHPDYSKPKEYIWLCKKCHINLHKAKYPAAELGVVLKEGT